MYCKGLRDPDSARGPNINWLWYDEAGMDENGLAWKIAIASVRVGESPQAWATTTPKGMGHWLYEFFIKQDIPQDAIDAFQSEGDSDRILIDHYHGTIEENKKNLDPGFYASILANYPSGWLRSQEVLGEFANEGGKIGDRAWFRDKVVPLPPRDLAVINLITDEKEREEEEKLEHITRRIRFWDLAATEKEYGKNANDPDETIGSLVSKSNWTQFYVENQVGGFWAWDQVKKIVCNTALRDGVDVHVWIEQEPGASGKALIAEFKSLFKKTPGLENHKVFGFLPEDRVLMANDWFSLAAEGKVWLCDGIWHLKFLDQVDGFLQMRHDDRVTSVSCAIRVLNPFKSWSKVPFISV
jgi:phage terminase large subunit-like protein